MEGEAARVGLEVAALGKTSSESLWLALLPANSCRPAQGVIKEWGFLSCLLGLWPHTPAHVAFRQWKGWAGPYEARVL